MTMEFRCPSCGHTNELLKEQVDKLSEYVMEAAGPESALVPISTLSRLVDRRHAVSIEEHHRAVVNVVQLDLLRRAHEDRSMLKQRIRKLEAELAQRD